VSTGVSAPCNAGVKDPDASGGTFRSFSRRLMVIGSFFDVSNVSSYNMGELSSKSAGESLSKVCCSS